MDSRLYFRTSFRSNKLFVRSNTYKKKREAEAISGKEFKKKEKVYEVGKDPTAEFMLLGMKILKPKKKVKKGK